MLISETPNMKLAAIGVCILAIIRKRFKILPPTFLVVIILLILQLWDGYVK